MTPTWFAVLACAVIPVASMRVRDPSDVIPPSAWAGDNSLFADYNVPMRASQPRDINADYVYNGSDITPVERLFVSRKNDTSVVLARDNARLHLTGVEVQKLGYSSNANDASFYGFNSAVNIANASTGYLSHVNITTHNGATNTFVYGAGSRLFMENAWLYSSGPAAHSIQCAGGGTAVARHVRAYTGGMRSSAFAVERTGGALNITAAVAHTSGTGSACLSAGGLLYADDVACEAEKAPVVVMDGPAYARLRTSSGMAGGLAAAVVYSSGSRTEGAVLDLDVVELTATGPDMPALWFGNTVATANLNYVELNTQSRLLVLANRSTVASTFDRFAGPEAGSGNATASVQPAVVNVYVTNSRLVGDIVAMQDSEINLYLGEGSSLVGSTYTDGTNASVSVRIRNNAKWTLTGRAEVSTLTNDDPTMKNIVTNGFNLVQTNV